MTTTIISFGLVVIVAAVVWGFVRLGLIDNAGLVGWQLWLHLWPAYLVAAVGIFIVAIGARGLP